jgi:hypothetical protein
MAPFPYTKNNYDKGRESKERLQSVAVRSQEVAWWGNILMGGFPWKSVTFTENTRVPRTSVRSSDGHN